MTEPQRPIFIVGCPRSGTTLLQLMLHSHPRIAIPPETRFLMDTYDRRRRFGDLTDPANRLALARSIVKPKKTLFADLGLDPQQVTDEIVAGPPTVGSALGIVFRAYAGRFGKPRWGDKRPGYFQQIPALMRLFPNAQVVHLIRDGRDCAASLKEMKWYKHDVYHALATWVESIDAGQRARKSLGPDAYYSLYYERLVADPKGQLAALCEFLGEAFDPAMCEPRTVAHVVPARKTWHADVRDALTTARIGMWRSRLADQEILLCEAVAGDRLRAHGYEVDGAGRPELQRYGRYLWVALHRRLAARKRDLIDLAKRQHEPSEVAERLTAPAS